MSQHAFYFKYSHRLGESGKRAAFAPAPFTLGLFPFPERRTRAPSPKRRLGAGLRTLFRNNRGLLLGSAEPFVQNPAYRTCASDSQNNQARRCQREYHELLKIIIIMQTSTSPSTCATFPEESPCDDAFVLPCPFDLSLNDPPQRRAVLTRGRHPGAPHSPNPAGPRAGTGGIHPPPLPRASPHEP